jgi:hypothetical protein
MPNVKIGNKTIAFPPGMSEDELAKEIRKIKIEQIKQPNPKPAKAKAEGGMMNKNLKPVDKKKNPGLAKLPTKVRNKMGYMKDGGAVKKKEGGMVLEIGLRPATKDEMKMAKKMKKPVKKANGGMARGTGSAIRGKGFKGVF